MEARGTTYLLDQTKYPLLHRSTFEVTERGAVYTFVITPSPGIDLLTLIKTLEGVVADLKTIPYRLNDAPF